MTMIVYNNSLTQRVLAGSIILFMLATLAYSVRSVAHAVVIENPEEVVTEESVHTEIPSITDTDGDTVSSFVTTEVLPPDENSSNDNETSENAEVPMMIRAISPESTISIKAHAIVCDLESDLPDWALGGADITETTATTWVASHEGCSFVSGWSFEWGDADATDPGDTLRGEAGAPWTSFGPTDETGVATAAIPVTAIGEGTHLWVREVLPEGYIPFTHDTHDYTNVDTHSAEFYCHTDVSDYDNLDRVDGVDTSNTYYCVAWNVREIPADMCTVTLLSGTDENPVDAIDDATTVVEKGGAFAKLLSFVSPRWTANIPGAAWIWGDDPVALPVDGVSQTFERTFGWHGPVTQATLSIAADDVYTSWINANLAGEDLNVANFKLTTQDEYDVTSLVAQGNNVLTFRVANDVNNTDPAKNPSGLLYKLVVSGTDPSCDIPYEPVVYGCTDKEASNYMPEATADDESCVYEPTYMIFGYAWHDENESDIWEGFGSDDEELASEGSLAGWGISITNGTTTYRTVTDEHGYYSFAVPAGTWTITEDGVSGWNITFPNSLSHVVTVPDVPTEEIGFSTMIRDLFIRTAHAQVPVTYGPFNFGNSEIPSTSGGGGGHRRTAQSNNVLSSGDGAPQGEVLGESTNIMPVGAPNTGAGGTSGEATIPTVFTILGIAISLGLVRVTRNVH